MKLLCCLLIFSAVILRAAASTPLWPGKPPQFLEGAPAEIQEERGTIRHVTVPAITLFLPPADKRTGMAIIVCAGGMRSISLPTYFRDQGYRLAGAGKVFSSAIAAAAGKRIWTETLELGRKAKKHAPAPPEGEGIKAIGKHAWGPLYRGARSTKARRRWRTGSWPDGRRTFCRSRNRSRSSSPVAS